MPLPLYYISAEEYSKKNASGFDAQRNCFHCSSKPLLSAIEAAWLCWKNLAHIAAFVDKLPLFTQKVADEIDCAKYPSPFIYPLESPVFIGVSGGEWQILTLHHPSSQCKHHRRLN